ncbi:MAG: phosphate ABC transporter permease subunit PstC [Spirochaetes bacterium]|nr:phosphate ABC transporter permease subunit PstC [Spirochaetota bacterium]
MEYKNLKKRVRVNELFINIILFVSSITSILITLGIVFELGKESILFFKSGVSILKFFTSTEWQPAIGNFGILPLLNSTLITSLIAMLISVPFGLFAAIYLSEYASDKVRSIVKPVLEILAGIPTIVYGFFALTFITPVLQKVFGEDIVEIYNMASAGIAMGILIIPLITTMSEDALKSVPKSLREGAYGLGATKFETSTKIVFPAAISGIAAAVIIGLSRAVGETMIVALAAGSGPNFTFNPFRAAETMTGYMVRISGGDVGYDTFDYNSIFVIGLLLFIVTLGLNILSRHIIKKFREVYD